MILIEGDPAKNIRDTRNITTVIKGGKVYGPAAIEKTLGIALSSGGTRRIVRRLRCIKSRAIR